METEFKIDLRKYIDWFFKWVWLMISFAVIFGFLAVLLNIVSPSPYRATASVVLLRSRAEVSLGSSIQTLSQEDMTLQALNSPTSGYYQAEVDQARTDRRLNSLLSIVPNGTIAQEVSQELEGVLTDKERNPSLLVAMVKGTIAEPEDGVKGVNTDNLQISAYNDDPVKAAAIANAWAKAFVKHINGIYGSSSLTPFSDINEQVNDARTQYEQSQEKLLKFLTEDDRINELKRQIAEDEVVVAQLRTGRQTAITAIMDTQVKVKQTLIQAYLENDSNNRLFAFNKNQEAKRQILGAWMDAEVNNRLAVVQRDRDLRLQMFNQTVQTEIDSRLAVVQQQQQERIESLAKAYTRKQNLITILNDAQQMHSQLVSGGESAARSNSLALLALKNRMFNVSEGLPSFDKLQLSTTTIDNLATPRGAADQIADLDAMIAAINEELTNLDTSINTLSKELLSGEGYALLDLLPPDYLIEQPTDADVKTLNDTIMEQYNSLFDVGLLASSADQINSDSPLFEEIKKLYPELFQSDAIMELAASGTENSELAKQANQAAQDLLDMKGWEGVLSYTVLDQPLSLEIIKRENELRLQQAEVSRLEQYKSSLIQDRDLAWQAYSTLLAKEQEVNIASASAGTEVSLASEAVPPMVRESGTLTSPVMFLLVGFVFGAAAAFVLEFKGITNSPVFYWDLLKKGIGLAIPIIILVFTAVWALGKELYRKAFSKAPAAKAAPAEEKQATAVVSDSVSVPVDEPASEEPPILDLSKETPTDESES